MGRDRCFGFGTAKSLMAASAAIMSLTLPAWGGSLNTPFAISQTGGSFPDVAYSSGSHTYLVVYGHGPGIRGRLVSADGQPVGAEFSISASAGIFPDIAHNAERDEFLVVWDDQRTPEPPVPSATWGQRIRAGDGQKVGVNFQIGDSGSVRGSAVAWSPLGNIHLAVWWRPGNVTRGRWVNADGTLGAAFDISTTDKTLYPTVEFGGAQFLVAWDCDCGNAYIRGRCVPPGGSPGTFVDITSENNQVRSNLAYDPGSATSPARWLVQFSQAHAATGADQYAQFAGDTCVPVPGSKPVANESYHEGDTYFGGDIAFLPSRSRYLGVFQVAGSQVGSGAQELDRDGNKVGGQVFLAAGGNGGEGVAADDQHGRFLAVWHAEQAHVFGRLYEPVKPVARFEAAPRSRAALLTWRNSPTGDCVSTLIRCKTTGYPVHAGDGELVIEQPGTSSSEGRIVHTGVAGRTRVYYAAFSKDSSFHFGEPVQASTLTYAPADFDGDNDVDQSDFGTLQACLSGESFLKSPECAEVDLDLDQDVDGTDLALFLRCWTGPDGSCDLRCLP